MSIEVRDKSRWPEDCRIDFNPRKTWLHLLQRLLHPARDGERVAPREFFDDEHKSWAIVDDGIPNHALWPIDQVGHIAQQQRLPIPYGHRHPGKRLGGDARRGEAQLKALVRCFDEAAGADMRAAGIAQQADVERIGNCFLHLVQRNVRGCQPLRID